MNLTSAKKLKASKAFNNKLILMLTSGDPLSMMAITAASCSSLLSLGKLGLVYRQRCSGYVLLNDIMCVYSCYVCTYVCMYVCMYVCIHVYMYGCVNVWMYGCICYSLYHYHCTIIIIIYYHLSFVSSFSSL